ncbi:hypothetical protein N7495_003441 [Penicillium taxi]|uniref:uncharacterized protein n=1 Tax=Penicillium taxi TaxID=168475 RepID=UPI0025451B45|nr:uncharacterized protein N7495_003441 [Penicillium taxi]KAJ5902913.1 hypothetical protein N7495_003441 [Penicillium taxi]
MSPVNIGKVPSRRQKQQAPVDSTTTRAGRVSKAPAPYVPVTGLLKAKRACRKKETAVVCVYCQRGNSPLNNSIVYCDGCDATWHQKCHDPPIENELITVKEAKWLCRKCKPPKRRPITFMRKPTQPASKSTRLVHPRLQHAPQLEVGGELFTSDEIRAYASCRSHAALVELVVHVSSQNPTLPIFPRNMRDLLASQFVAHSQLPVSAAPLKSKNSTVGPPVRKKTSNTTAISKEPELLTTKRPRTNSAPAKPELNAIIGKNNCETEAPEPEFPTRKRARTESIVTKPIITAPSSRQTRQDKPSLRNAANFPDPEKNEDVFGVELTEIDVNCAAPIKLEPDVEAGVKVEGHHRRINDHRLYPRPGNGFATSTDPIDLDIIAEEEGYLAFSHSVHGRRTWAYLGSNMLIPEVLN